MRGHNFSRAEHTDLAPAAELVREGASWRDDPRKVADLGRWLEERCYFRTVEERWTFVEKIARPGNDDLYDEMVAEEREEERRRLFEEERAFESEGRYQ